MAYKFVKTPKNVMNPTPNPSFNELKSFHELAKGVSNADNTRHHYSRNGFLKVHVELFEKVQGFEVLVGFDDVIVQLAIDTKIY